LRKIARGGRGIDKPPGGVERRIFDLGGARGPSRGFVPVVVKNFVGEGCRLRKMRVEKVEGDLSIPLMRGGSFFTRTKD